MNQATGTDQVPDAISAEAEGRRTSPLLWVFVWVASAGLSAALAYAVVRRVAGRPPTDPTSQRIQQLIDEANQLLKTLDDQKRPS